MNARDLIKVWLRLLLGYEPSLSIEITRECPLSCPGCYACQEGHLGDVPLRSLREFKGQELINGVLKLVKKYRPLHVSMVGGEPLVRYRELSELLPELSRQGLHTQVVTSAVRPIPKEWIDIPRLSIVVSVDGLQPEHDARRKPATYDRLLRHIQGHRITVHCTITRPMTERSGYIKEFVEVWNAQPEVKRIWMSIFTPQVGSDDSEVVPWPVRQTLIEDLKRLRRKFPKLDLPEGLLDVYGRPPRNPSHCAFARLTRSVTADLSRPILPCQLGGNPDCSQCGCYASAGLEAIARHRLPVGIRIGAILDASVGICRTTARFRRVLHGDPDSVATVSAVPATPLHNPE